MSLVCDKRNLAFVHIPGTSGTNLAYHLERIGFYPLPRTGRLTSKQHLLASEIPDNYNKFAIIRDPWDREITSYHYVKKNIEQYKHITNLINTAYMDMFDCSTFENYIRSKYIKFKDVRSRYMTSSICTLSYYIDTECRVLRYENLEQDYSKLAEEYDLPTDALKTRINNNPRTEETYWTEELKEIVLPFIQKDLERYYTDARM